MVGYLKYVLRRTLLVLGALAVGLLGWPGDVGAQSLLNAGSIESSGARRIRVEPRAPVAAAAEAGSESSGSMTRGLRALWGIFGAGTQETEAAEAESASGAAGMLAAATEAQAETPAPGAALFAEFGAKPPARTPYEASRAALAAAR